MSACTWKTSVSAASNGCCQRGRGASPTRISSGLTRTRLLPSAAFSHRTVPVSRYRRPARGRSPAGAWWSSCTGSSCSRAITCSPGSAASLPRTSSVTPSAKYSSLGGAQVLERQHRQHASAPAASSSPGACCAASRTARPARAGSRSASAASDRGAAARGARRSQRRPRFRGAVARAAATRGAGAAAVGGRRPSASARANSAARARTGPPATWPAPWPPPRRRPPARSSRTCRSGRGVSVNRRAMIACAVGAGERRLAGEHLVEHARRASRCRSGASTSRSPAGLLGAHVGRRADRHAGLGQLARRRPRSARAMPKSATSAWPSR